MQMEDQEMDEHHGLHDDDDNHSNHHPQQLQHDFELDELSMMMDEEMYY